ncbi:MAG: hypothetical protein KDD03_13310 [Gelidibacter sp.]|nr:hypothetical protein [Gelidibacter sp.]
MELKFRALCEVEYKDTSSKNMMVYFTHLELDNGLWYNPNDKDIYHINEWLSKPMQFTNFQDCEKTDIYDGDILSDEVMTDEGLKMSLQQVFWDDKKGCWMLDFSHLQNKTSSSMLSNELLAYKYKIVGNIYENPGLLNLKS